MQSPYPQQGDQPAQKEAHNAPAEKIRLQLVRIRKIRASFIHILL